jgi:hypothetical protein
VRLVHEELAVANRCFRVLLDAHDVRLNVLAAPTLSRR